MRTRTSNSVVRLTLALIVALVLVNAISVCPLLAGAMHHGSSCCPHSKRPYIPCTESTGNNCPYVMLETAKSERGVAAVHFSAIPVAVGAEVHPIARQSEPLFTHYLSDNSETYLAHRVLRL